MYLWLVYVGMLPCWIDVTIKLISTKMCVFWSMNNNCITSFVYFEFIRNGCGEGGKRILTSGFVKAWGERFKFEYLTWDLYNTTAIHKYYTYWRRKCLEVTIYVIMQLYESLFDLKDYLCPPLHFHYRLARTTGKK